MLSQEVCIFVSISCWLHTWHHDVMVSHFFVQCHRIVKAVMAFYFSWTAKNMLKRRGKVRNGSVFKKILCMPSWHHDVMLSHLFLYSVTELSRRWWHFISVELHKICLKEEEWSVMVQFFRKKNYVCLPHISRCCFIYSFKQVVRNSLATFSH